MNWAEAWKETLGVKLDLPLLVVAFLAVLSLYLFLVIPAAVFLGS